MQTEPINFMQPVGDVTDCLLPVSPRVFADRASRFQQVAKGHALEGWLNFLAQLSQAQHRVLQGLSDVVLPSSEQLHQSIEHGMPVFASIERPVQWRAVLKELLEQIETAQLPESLTAVLVSLKQQDDASLDTLADLLFDGEITSQQAASLPLVAAALQVVMTAMAARLPVLPLKKLDTVNLCPCCGSPAVASIVRLGAAVNNLRYLHCGLCNAEWNVPRAVCTSCGSDKELALQEIEGSSSAVRAECCDGCKSYLKIVYQEKDPNVDPVADDLATLALDMLVDDAGYQRTGPNLFFVATETAN